MEIELQQEWAIIPLPRNVIDFDITANIYMDGVIEKVSTHMDMRATREAIRKAEEYIDDEDTFELTDRGREFLESLKSIIQE